MNKRFILPALLCAAFSVQASAQNLPDVVQQQIDVARELCQEANSGAHFSEGDAILVGDFNGDKRTDYVVEEGMFSCDGSNLPYAGTAGSAITVYAGKAGGEAYEAFSALAQEAQIINGKLYLVVTGELCGQNTRGKSHAEYRGCLRPLVWKARSGKFDYAPLSQVRKLPAHH